MKFFLILLIFLSSCSGFVPSDSAKKLESLKYRCDRMEDDEFAIKDTTDPFKDMVGSFKNQNIQNCR